MLFFMDSVRSMRQLFRQTYLFSRQILTLKPTLNLSVNNIAQMKTEVTDGLNSKWHDC